jgi:hypothetical protein
MVHEVPVVVVIIEPLSPPLGRVVALGCEADLAESHQAAVPMIDESSHVNKAFHVGGVIGDEVWAEDAAQ